MISVVGSKAFLYNKNIDKSFCDTIFLQKNSESAKGTSTLRECPLSVAGTMQRFVQKIPVSPLAIRAE
jgi:hypothetical protein